MVLSADFAWCTGSPRTTLVSCEHERIFHQYREGDLGEYGLSPRAVHGAAQPACPHVSWPGIEIGEEVHHLDQFIRFEAGEGKAILDGVERPVGVDDALVISQGTRHNIINTGSTDLKLYMVYSPPEHKDGITQATKADEHEEYFDGKTTESI